jgi:pyridoxine 5'-phosphate synthase PdxJ
MRNEIYARHGYSFKKLEYRQIFEKYDWYVPVSTNVDAELTPIEKANITKIQEFENYYNDYGEFDGR